MQGAYTEMRERCPVVHNSRYGGHLHVLRYDEVRDTANRAQDFSSADGAFIPPSGLPRLAPIDYDGPEHAFWCAAMQTPLTPAAVRELKPEVTDVVDRHIDAIGRRRKRLELFSALAEPIPAHVVGRVAGLSEPECRTLREVAISAFQSIGTASFERNKAEFDAFIRDQIAQRRRLLREDYLSRLATGRIGDREIDDDDIIGVLMTLLLGGHHSTAALPGLLHHAPTSGCARSWRKEDRSSRRSSRRACGSPPLHLGPHRDDGHDHRAVPRWPSRGTRLFVNYASANHDPLAVRGPGASPRSSTASPTRTSRSASAPTSASAATSPGPSSRRS